MNKFSELIFGYACYGYQLFFNEESAAKEIEKNVCLSKPTNPPPLTSANKIVF